MSYYIGTQLLGYGEDKLEDWDWHIHTTIYEIDNRDLLYSTVWASLLAQLVENLPAIKGGLALISGLGRSPGEGKGYPLQYSGLENSMGTQRGGRD